jgi:D-lactate dehydrogenase (cytochrome)
MIELQERRLREGGFEYVVFGHIGDCHLHVNILPRDEAEMVRAKELYMELAREAVRLGGTVAGEHGIGKVKHSFLEVMHGAEGIARMRAVKAALDPKGILGRGNVFPWE